MKVSCLVLLLTASPEPRAVLNSNTFTPMLSKTAYPAAFWTGDLDTLLKHRVIRVGVPYSKTLYYTVKGVQWGVAYEGGREFEKYLNRKYPQGNKNLKIHLMYFVAPREKVVEKLNEGTLDLLVAGLTITPERQKAVDFSIPTLQNVNEVVVTGPDSPELVTIDDLGGKEVFARKTSSYWEHLQELNARFQKENKAPVILRVVPEDLGDEDLLEMVNAGLLPAIVVNEWTANLWSKLLTKEKVHSDIYSRQGCSIWMGCAQRLAQVFGCHQRLFENAPSGHSFWQRDTREVYRLHVHAQASSFRIGNKTI